MPFTKQFIFYSLLLCSCAGRAQQIDHTASFRHINQDSWFRFHYDNDYFTKTDYYYSQGITLEYVHSGLRKNPLSRLLITPRNSITQYGLAFNLFGYTPTNTGSNDILYGDRPFASCMSVKSFAISVQPQNRSRLSTALSIGVLGPAALGREIQTGIHRWLKNPLPKGWQHQVRNAIILNYQVEYEKNLVTKRGLLIDAATQLRLGTLHDKLSAGINIITGRFNDPFASNGKRKKTSCYLYAQGRYNLIGYDATLQGGLFNRNSPYTIAANNVNRLNFQADAGIVVQLNNILLSYTQSYLSQEFNTGLYHRWGGVSLGYCF